VASPASRALVETGPHCTLGLDLVFACGRKAWQRLLFFPNTSESHPLLKQQRLQTSIKSSSAYIQVQTITPVTTVSFVKNILNSASTLEVYCSDCVLQYGCRENPDERHLVSNTVVGHSKSLNIFSDDFLHQFCAVFAGAKPTVYHQYRMRSLFSCMTTS